MTDTYVTELEPEFCPDCSEGTVIVDDHIEGDRLGYSHRVLDLACGHSLSWRIKS